MRSSELLTAVRVQGRLSTSDDDYTDARILQELTDTIKSVFGATIVGSRSGAWLKQVAVSCDGEKFRFRIPARCFSLESVELIDSAARYEVIGDQVVFETAPSSGMDVLFTCYLAPSLLTADQSAGVITAVDVSTATIVVAALPQNQQTSIAIASGNRLDIVHPDGWHELALVNEVCSIAGTTGPFSISFDGADLSDVETGDYVRAAGQTEWPCLQDEYHRALADMTAARILRARGYSAKAAELEQQSAGDIARFADVLEPRVKDAPRVAVPTNTYLRSGGRGRSTSTTFQW